MPFDPSTDLDPALMEPSDQFLRNLPPATPIPSFQVNTGMENDNDEDLPLTPLSAHGSDTGFDVSIPPATSSIVHTVTSSDKMQATGRILAKRMRLTTESEADLDRFCAVSDADIESINADHVLFAFQTPSQADHMIMLYAQGLQIRDLLMQKQAVEEWKISDQLTVNLLPSSNL